MGYSEWEFDRIDQRACEIEDRRESGRCPVHGCLLIIGRNGEVFKKAICPNCKEGEAEGRREQ
jgi:hypothetical protein